jgi:hypothetical protein
MRSRGERAGGTHGWRRRGDSYDVRRGGGVEQDVAVLEILGVGTVLQVLLQAVAALVAADGRDGRLVDDDGAVLGLFSRHDVRLESVGEVRV